MAKKKPSKDTTTSIVGHCFKINLPIGEVWTVHMQPKEVIMAAMDGIACWGFCDRLHNEIYLRNDYKEAQALSTICHELFHAIATVNQGSVESKDEAINEELAANLCGMLIPALAVQWPKILEEVRRGLNKVL